MIDKRFKKIDTLLLAYGSGEFDRRVTLSQKKDSVDLMLMSLHMLAEELQESTVHKDFFTEVIDHLSEMVLVVSPDGTIEMVNETLCRTTGYTENSIVGQSINILVGPKMERIFARRSSGSRRNETFRLWNKVFTTVSGATIPVEIMVKPLKQKSKIRRRLLVTARDISTELTSQKDLLRSVTDIQERDRIRMAQELHDGLSQELSVIQFLLTGIINDPSSSPVRERLLDSRNLLGKALSDLRCVCQNLMPLTLEDIGLIPALRELVHLAEVQGLVSVSLTTSALPSLDTTLQRDIYRICQEFIANAVRHGKAGLVDIRLSESNGTLELQLRDDGRGFEPALVQGGGMGLRNMNFRTLSQGGTFHLESAPGCGAFARISFKLQ